MGGQLGLLAVQVTSVLAQDDQPDPSQGGQGAEFGKAAPIGLVVVLLLLIGTVFLVRSMNRRLRKLPQNFPGYDPAVDGPGGDTARRPGTRG